MYTAAAGMMAQQVQIDVISNNMSNAGTPGYHRDEVALRSFPQMLMTRLEKPSGNLRHQITEVIGPVETGSVVDGISTSDRDGTLQETGNPFDLALRGDVYFTVRDPGGEVFYTRNGGFMPDDRGRLVTPLGMAVLGENNGRQEEIYVTDGILEVNRNGTLVGGVNAQGQTIPRLSLVAGRAPGDNWHKIGDTLYQSDTPAGGADNYEVYQGYREGSNVNPVAEMVRMIAAMRLYEANQKVIQATDSTLERVTNEVGRA